MNNNSLEQLYEVASDQKDHLWNLRKLDSTRNIGKEDLTWLAIRVNKMAELITTLRKEFE